MMTEMSESTLNRLHELDQAEAVRARDRLFEQLEKNIWEAETKTVTPRDSNGLAPREFREP